MPAHPPLRLADSVATIAAQLSVEEHTDVDTADWELKLSALGYAVRAGGRASGIQGRLL